MIDRIAKNSKRFIVLALILMAVGTLGAWLFQTSFGQVSVKQIAWETSTGYSLNGILLVPKDRGVDEKLPAIVTTHGWFNTKEMQDLNYVELSRRGYVVLAIDMYGHGGSEIVPEDSWFTDGMHGNGVFDAVDYLAHLDYVDSEKIGVTGHSNGALASSYAIRVDDLEEENLIAAVLLVANDAFYTQTGDFSQPFSDFDQLGNFYGSRDVGIVAPLYDDFFFRVKNEQESVGHTAPRDFMNQVTAQSFLAFGEDKEEMRQANTYYYSEDNQSFRVIYPIQGSHTLAHFSQEEVARVIDFFEKSLGAPRPLDSGDQIWPGKVAFNALALIGFLIFFTNLMIYLSRSRHFAALRRVERIQVPRDPQFVKGVNRLVLATGIFTVVSFYANTWTASVRVGPFKQLVSWVLGMWSLTMGAFIFLGIRRLANRARKRGPVKLTLPLRAMRYTILLALIALVLSYAFVFLADYFFQVDFRLWLFALRAFEGNKLMHILLHFPFFLIFYMGFGLLIGLFRETRKKELSSIVASLLMSLPLILLVVFTYGTFFSTGYLPHEFVGFGSDGGILGIWLFVTSVNILVTSYINQKVYIATKNIYLASIASALLITIMEVTNTLTVL